jgi:leader peptidase (prepilin peptidase) / N-methyltransferase
VPGLFSREGDVVSGLTSSTVAMSRGSLLIVLALTLAAAASHLLLASIERWPQALLFAGLISWLAVIDAQRSVLPNALTYALTLTGLVEGAWFDAEHLSDRVIALLAGFGVFAALGSAYRTRTNQVGLGLGDAKFLAGVGAWLGWSELPGVVLVASCSAIIWSAPAILRHDKATPLRVRFGPFLALGGWAGWLMLHAN